MPKFSLIIPVYNVERYLADCLDSCINQTFKDIEIICINDCSPDGSSKILDEYAKRDPRIKVIIHEKNRGLGGARNTGIEAAKGEYCWFIDSDDIIALDACEFLFSVIKKTQIDIIRFNLTNFDDDRIFRMGIFSRIDECGWPYNIILTKKDHTGLKETEVTACTFAVLSALLKKFRFREQVVHEDVDFVPILFSEAMSIRCINSAPYFRRLHNKSITGGGIAEQIRIVDKLAAINSLNNYIISFDLPKSHFCVKLIQGQTDFLKKNYEKFPEIHTPELDGIIKRVETLGKCFSGDPRLYDNIINTYGNTPLLEFMLRVYRFFIKRLTVFR
ncbi:glycosyltransferase family 2 protein [Breznakiellaceae bacterium SP9]